MSTGPSYRTLSERALDKTASILGSFPKEGLPTADLAATRIAQAQVAATVAVTQALLEIGDVLRALTQTPDEG